MIIIMKKMKESFLNSWMMKENLIGMIGKNGIGLTIRRCARVIRKEKTIKEYKTWKIQDNKYESI